MLNSANTEFLIFSTSDCKTLGLTWQPADDLLRIQLKHVNHCRSTNESFDLSYHFFFEVFGFISPLIISTKILSQKPWPLRSSCWWNSLLLDEICQQMVHVERTFGRFQYCLSSHCSESNASNTWFFWCFIEGVCSCTLLIRTITLRHNFRITFMLINACRTHLTCHNCRTGTMWHRILLARLYQRTFHLY